MFQMVSTTVKGWQTTPLEANLAFCLPAFVNKVLLVHKAYSISIVCCYFPVLVEEWSNCSEAL